MIVLINQNLCTDPSWLNNLRQIFDQKWYPSTSFASNKTLCFFDKMSGNIEGVYHLGNHLNLLTIMPLKCFSPSKFFDHINVLSRYISLLIRTSMPLDVAVEVNFRMYLYMRPEDSPFNVLIPGFVKRNDSQMTTVLHEPFPDGGIWREFLSHVRLDA